MKTERNGRYAPIDKNECKNVSAGAFNNCRFDNYHVLLLIEKLYLSYTLHYDLEAWEVGTGRVFLLYPLFVVIPLCWNLYYEVKNNFLLYIALRGPC